MLFDLDGTLIKSMELHFKCWENILKKVEKKISREEFFLLEGTNINQLMMKYSGIKDKEKIQDLVNAKDQLFINAFKFELYEGALDVLQLLKAANKKIGLVTASSKKRLENTAPKSFLGLFDAIVVSEEAGRGKPFPDPYLKALSMLEIASSEALVIENAPLGIMAARQAKITCVGMTHTLPKKLLMDANWHYENFIEILKGSNK